MNQKTRRILCLDGGGLRGVFSAAVVRHLEEVTRHPAWQLFDVIMGTSTGSVMTAMLATRKPAAELIKLYQEVGFEDLQNPTPEKRTEALVKTLKKHIGPSTFGQLKGIKVAIPFRDTRTGEVVFASNFLDDKSSWADTPLWKIVRRSTALPPLFTPDDDRYLDGGYSAYANPSYAALRAALEQGWLKQGKPKALQIHSVGTTYHAPLAGKLGLIKGIEKWVKRPGENLAPSELLQLFINDAMIQDVGFLQHQLLKAAHQRGDLVYKRYNVRLETKNLDPYKAQFRKVKIPMATESLIRTYRIMDGPTSMQRLATIGGIVAKKKIQLADFPAGKPEQA